MSKKFPKIEYQKTPTPQKVLPAPEFKCEQHNYLICDLDWGDGKNFLHQAKQWLMESCSQQTLYYYAMIPRPSLHYDFGSSSLGRELTEKWPPILPGTQIIPCADQRIILIVFFNDACKALEGLLQHRLPEIDSKQRRWGFDRVLIHQQLEEDLAALLRHCSRSNVLVLGHSLEGHTLRFSPGLKNSPWPWAKSKINTKLIHIVGAGLAGSYLARFLANEGWQVEVYEAQASAATQGSGNRFSVLYPKFSLYQAPFTELLNQAYPYAFQVWSDILGRKPELGQLCSLAEDLGGDAELMEYLSLSSNWFSPQQELWMHKSLMLDIPLVCEYLLHHPQIKVNYHHPISEVPAEGLWVFAAGYQSPCEGVKGMRGQMTFVDTCYSEKVIYCQQGHMTPVWKGVHALGATFSPDLKDLNPRSEDDEKNMAGWQSYFQRELKFKDHWVGIRSVSLDHLPLVGWLPKRHEFMNDFKLWRHHANWVMADNMANHPVLIFSGFGSRGLVYIPLLARVLHSLISPSAPIISNLLMQALAPGRFLKKHMIHASS